MSTASRVLIVLLSLVAGFGGGFTYEALMGNKTVKQATSSKATTDEQTLPECLKEVWGDDKYAAISANASLATTEDNLASLKCYD